MSSTIKNEMTKKLQAAFSPQALEVINESHLHAGHHHDNGRPFDGKGETHFRIKIAATKFAGLSALDRHRAIHQVLHAELKNAVHALAIEAKP